MAPLVKLPHDKVEDDEILYRATRPSHISYKDGRVVVSSQAFSDSKQEISVDRADLQQANPRPTLERLDSTGGVVSVTARQVRALAPLTHQFRHPSGSPVLDEEGQPQTASNGVDVFPDPFPPGSPDNSAHALIKGVPPFPHAKMFERLIKSLSRQAQVEIQPSTT